MDKNEAIARAKQYKVLLDEHYDRESVYLFGSYAMNENTEDSDIDVAVIVKKIEGDFFPVNPLLWKLRRQIDDRIEPILIHVDEDRSGFLEEIQRNGIKITLTS